MEHYILNICNEFATEENQHIIEDYLTKLTPTSFHHQYTLHFASQVALLLKPIACYSAVLSRSPNKDVEWKGPAESLNIKDVIPGILNGIDSADELASTDYTEHISASIHSLADQLPAFGTYKLDILLGSDVLQNLSVSEAPVLAGAFYRLTKWHSAHFAIYVQNKLDEKLEEWCKVLNADILKDSSMYDLGPTLWRGGIQLEPLNDSDNISCNSFEMKLDLVQNEDNFFIFKSLHEDIKHENAEHIVMSPKLHVVNQCSFASIPSYMIAPVIFKLHLGMCNLMNEESSYLNHLVNKDEEALIVRLDYARINEKTKREKKYCTNRWIKTVSSGFIKDADCFLSKFEDYISFVLTKSKESDHILAFPIQEPSCWNESIYFNYVNYKVPCSSNLLNDLKEEKCSFSNNLSKIPIINKFLFYLVIENLRNYKKELYQNGCLSSGSEFNSEISSIYENIWKISNNFLSGREIAHAISFEEIDSSDWSERIHLLFKQMQREEEKKSFAPNALLGLGPKLAQQSVSFSCEDVKKYFLPSGEPRIVTNTESIHPLGNLNHLIAHDFNAVIHLRWPEIVDCIYHDLYYNSSYKAEEKEAVGNRMVSTYVKHETTSTCSKQQMMQNFAIIISEKSSLIKEFRSPSCRKAASSVAQNINQKKGSDCKENVVKDLIAKKILSTSRLASSQNMPEKSSNQSSIKRKMEGPVRCSPRKKIPVSYVYPSINRITSSQNISEKEVTKQKNLTYENSKQSSVKRKMEAPVRCSPRKKIPDNYSYSSVNRSMESNKNGKLSKSSELPDLLKKKLRNAVATALENNGINLDDAFFKPCGKRLFTVCQAFVQDISQKKGKTSEYLQKIADAHVKQVIEFERMNENKK